VEGLKAENISTDMKSVDLLCTRVYGIECSNSICFKPNEYTERGDGKTIPPSRSTKPKRAKELICESSDTRRDMVADLRSRILCGTYEIRAEQVVEKIIQHGAYILGLLEGNDCHPRKT
jgi:hypothetical protein